MRSGGANAWRMLCERQHVRLVFDDLDRRCGGGMIEEHADHRVIALDHGLDRRMRHAVLLHELLHDERDALFPPGTPQPVIDVVERWIEAEVVELLVPRAQLAEFVRRRQDDHGVTAAMVADEFDVPSDIAGEALRRLAHRWGVGG